MAQVVVYELKKLYDVPALANGEGIVQQDGVLTAAPLAVLDDTGKVPSELLPAIAITNTYSVASQAAMLVLNAHLGDIAIRTDLGQTFILGAADPTVLSNWHQLEFTSAVTSVAGKTGTVALVQADVDGLVADLAAKETPAGAQSKADAAEAAAVSAAAADATTKASAAQTAAESYTDGAVATEETARAAADAAHAAASPAHAASAVSLADTGGHYAAADVEAALAEIATADALKLAASAVDTDGTLAANSDAHVASQKAVKTYVDAHSGSLTASSVATPWIVAHRGGSYAAPENTIQAIAAAYAAGIQVVKIDAQKLADGSIGVMHDTTVDYTSSASGNVSQYAAGAWQALALDASSWFAAGYPNLTGAPLLADVFRQFGARLVYLVECKTAGIAPQIAALATAMGLKNNVIIASFTLSDVTAAANAGYQALAVLQPPYSTTAATLVADGATYAAVSAADVTDVYVQSLVAAGIKVHVYNIFRRSELAHWTALGAVGFHTDNPVWVAALNPVLTSDPFALGVPFSGQVSKDQATRDVNRGIFTGTPYRFQLDQNGDRWVMQGWACPLANAAATWHLQANMTLDQAASPADTTRWGAIGFCCPDDGKFQDTFYGSGYYVIIRESGSMSLFRQDPGSPPTATQIGSTVATTALTVGTAITVKIDVTPTSITVTRTDSGGFTAISANDATYRGGYFHFGKNDQNKSAKWSWASVAIS